MRVLAVQPGAMGDVILSLPALGALREMASCHAAWWDPTATKTGESLVPPASRRPVSVSCSAGGTAGEPAAGTPAVHAGAGGYMEIWAERANLPLVSQSFYADRTRPLAATGIDSYPLPARTLAAIRKFDLIVSWRGSKLPELVHAVKAAHSRAFFPFQFPPAGEVVHLCDFRRAQIRALFQQQFGRLPKSAFLESEPRVFLEAENVQFAAEYMRKIAGARKRFVVLHPGASGPGKRWPARFFAEAARKAVARLEKAGLPDAGSGPIEIMLTRGPLDGQAVEETVRALGGLPHHVVEIANLRSLAAVLARASGFIGNDTGITHLAAAVGAPTVAVFVSSDPRIWAPRGPNVRVLVQPTVEEAVEALCSRQ